jgi:hypothetical protein
MLFDLRGRGRRSTVRVLYIGLALLIGVGLVGFGVGGGLGGAGLFSSASNSESTNGASFSSQIKKYRKETQRNPSDATAWAGLATALLHESGREGFTTSTGAITSKGKELFKQASQAWQSYLALNPAKPNSELAQLVYRIYGEEGLNEPAKAVQALQIVVAARPESAAYFSYLAEFAYKAHNEGIGDLAAEKAVTLAPSSERTRLKTELAEVKRYPNPNEKTYTTTTNGKTYAVKKAANGEFTGTQIQTTPAPASSSTKTITTKTVTTKK